MKTDSKTVPFHKSSVNFFSQQHCDLLLGAYTFVDPDNEAYLELFYEYVDRYFSSRFPSERISYFDGLCGAYLGNTGIPYETELKNSLLYSQTVLDFNAAFSSLLKLNFQEVPR